MEIYIFPPDPYINKKFTLSTHRRIDLLLVENPLFSLVMRRDFD